MKIIISQTSEPDSEVTVEYACLTQIEAETFIKKNNPRSQTKFYDIQDVSLVPILERLFNIQNNLNHNSFQGVFSNPDRLWKQFGKLQYNLLDFYTYLDDDNKKRLISLLEDNYEKGKNV